MRICADGAHDKVVKAKRNKCDWPKSLLFQNWLMKFTFFTILAAVILVIPGNAQAPQAKVYEVTVSALKVRSDTNTKSKVLYNLPKGSFVYDAGGDAGKEDTVDGIQGQWIGLYNGYVFSGYLKPVQKQVESLDSTCTMTQNTATCDNGNGKKVSYRFSATTPLSGSWIRYDEETGCKHLSTPDIYEKSARRLAEALRHGQVFAIYETGPNKENVVLQFIVRVQGRGAC